MMAKHTQADVNVIALIGERFDGHEFIAGASEAGAAGALVSQMQALDIPQVKVDDTREALGRLAAYWRSQFSGKLIGITGSNGKTSVKEMCSKILGDYVGGEAVLATRGNLNNDIGMPMMLLELREQQCIGDLRLELVPERDIVVDRKDVEGVVVVVVLVHEPCQREGLDVADAVDASGVVFGQS
mgnify:CR=1 FL=1